MHARGKPRTHKPTSQQGLAAARARSMALVVANNNSTNDDDDFETLQRVEAALCEKLRRDENSGSDLGDQLSRNWTWRSSSSTTTTSSTKGAHEYFAEDPGISVPYCGGGKKMIVFAVLMDHSGLTKRAGGIVVVNKTEHQLPMFVLTFEPTAQLYQHAAGAAMGLAGLTGPAAAARLAQLRAQLGLGGGGGGFPFGAGAAAAAAAAYGAPPPAPAHRAPRPAARPRNRRR